MNTTFSDLTPDLVLDLTEAVLGERCAAHCRALNSYINRVYEITTDQSTVCIAKFYRPGRWSETALLDEHEFMRELQESDVPVVAPLANRDGRTLHRYDEMFYTVFPKQGGRVCDEPSEDQWRQLGRLIARTHLVGAQHPPEDRITLRPDISTARQLEKILQTELIPPDLARRYEKTVRSMIRQTEPLFDDTPMIRIHGDCHYQNIIDRLDQSFRIIDFDDMAVGPPVQDVWMLLPGRLQNSIREIDLFLEGYETFREFELVSLRLIEPLRAMRYVHYTCWCALQAADGGFARLAPDWGSHSYWQQEIREMEKQLIEIEDAQCETLPF
jgi:Ser/Thr protein kinase RdoA (MazF antagonist)